MSSSQWHDTVSFTARLMANMRMSVFSMNEDLPSLGPEGLAAKASATEEGIFRQASSIDEYERECEHLCLSLKESLGATASAPSPSRTACSNEDSPTETIGPYKVQHYASGLFSTIYKSWDSKSGESIAIKVTVPSGMTPPHDSEREARLLKLLSQAPSVVPLISAEWSAGGRFIIVLPFLPCNLGQLLHQRRLSERQRKLQLEALFRALAHIHHSGIIHRDIKPSNILSLTPDGPVYLADFGIAWKNGDPGSEPPGSKITDIGTTCYRPPELLFGYRAYSKKVDLWAAGCVVAECLREGEPLFDAGDLGSDLALIRSIFTTLGTPTETSWPESQNLPDWGKLQFTKYPRKGWRDVFPGAGPKELSLVDNLIRFQSTERLTANEVLEHPYFSDVPGTVSKFIK